MVQLGIRVLNRLVHREKRAKRDLTESKVLLGIWVQQGMVHREILASQESRETRVAMVFKGIREAKGLLEILEIVPPIQDPTV